MAGDEIAEGMRKCPFCAEIIRSEAKICRFCQRDLPPDHPSEDNGIAAESPPEVNTLRYGARVSSPIMGDGTVVSRPDKDAVRVLFDRDSIERTVAASDLEPGPVRRSSARSVPSSGPDDTLIAAAWVTAFILPLIGFICGVILVAKGQVGHGVGSMIASLLMLFFWGAVFVAFVG